MWFLVCLKKYWFVKNNDIYSWIKTPLDHINKTFFTNIFLIIFAILDHLQTNIMCLKAGELT